MGLPVYEQLEIEYADFAKSKYAVTVNSGTSALHLSLVALGIGKGDEVIVPDFTMAACGFAVSYVGATVVTVDCDDSLNIDVNKIESAITAKTKAIMPVHIYGRLCNMNKIKEIASKYNLYIIEDGCEAQGAAIGGKSDLLCFSFYKNKIISGEEGGIICTDSHELYEKMRYLKNMAFGIKHDYFHGNIGYNYRITDSSAFKALNNLRNYSYINKKRRLKEQKFQESYRTIPRDAVWVYDMVFWTREQRDELFQLATKSGLNPRLFFKPLSSMPMWRQKIGERAQEFSERGFYVPILV